MRSFTILAAVLGSLALAGPAVADDRKHDGQEYKYEYKDGTCKYEYKSNGREVKEERKCKGGPHAYAPHPAYGERHAWNDRPQGGVIWNDPRPSRGYDLPPPPKGPSWGEPYQDRSGRFCREYQTDGMIGGRMERLYGTACLAPDGSWEFQR